MLLNRSGWAAHVFVQDYHDAFAELILEVNGHELARTVADYRASWLWLPDWIRSQMGRLA